MIEHFRVHPAAPAPRRDDDHRHAHARAVRAARDSRRCPGKISLIVDTVDWPCAGDRRRRRHDVIEEAALFVVVDEEHGLTEQLRVRCQDVEELRDVPGAEISAPSSDARCTPLVRRSTTPAAACRAARRPRKMSKRRSGSLPSPATLVPVLARCRRAACRLRVLVLVEIQQRVVAVVADVRLVSGPAPETRGVEPDADVLVDLPGDAGPLQPLGDRWTSRSRLRRW